MILRVPGVCVWQKSEVTKNLVNARKANLRTCSAEARKICWEIDSKNVIDSSVYSTQIDENRRIKTAQKFAPPVMATTSEES
jgi:hypothetical protein